MGFKLVICPPNYQDDWPAKLREAIPDIDVQLCPTVGEAMEVIGDAGVSFDHTRPVEALTERIEQLSREPASVLSFRERALERVGEHYCWESVTDRYEALFQRLVAKS